MSYRRSFYFVCCFSLLLTRPGFAWGPAGHHWVTDRAIDNLNGKFKELFSPHRDALVQRTMDPDYRKEQDPEEASRHFVDLERYGEHLFADGEADFDQVVIQFGRDAVQKNGTGPWAAERTFNRLVEAFQQRHLEPILLYSSDLSHYLADLHQPFHTTENFDGQLTGQVDIHARFESDLVNRYLDQIGFSKTIPSNLGSVLPALFDVVLESYQWVDDLLLADNRIVSELAIDRKQFQNKGKERKIYPDPYFRRMFEEVGRVLEDRLNQAAYRVASLWWMAWEKAGEPDF